MTSKPKQDKRCPLGLKCHPTQYCPLAIQRLKALERADGNVSHLQESKIPGCDWYCADKDSNYCFFKYIHDNSGKDHSTIDIAEKLSITQAAVYSGLNRAITKLKEMKIYKLLKGEK